VLRGVRIVYWGFEKCLKSVCSLRECWRENSGLGGIEMR
jgi:hypothetical protein